VAELARQILKVLSHLHELDPPMVHGHVDPEHVLCNQDIPNFKTCEFKLIGIESLMSSPVEAFPWEVDSSNQFLAPEIFSNSSCLICPKADIYSLGMLVYYLLTGELPHDNNETLNSFR
jgi:serine/threonine protein kinase